MDGAAIVAAVGAEFGFAAPVAAILTGGWRAVQIHGRARSWAQQGTNDPIREQESGK